MKSSDEFGDFYRADMEIVATVFMGLNDTSRFSFFFYSDTIPNLPDGKRVVVTVSVEDNDE